MIFSCVCHFLFTFVTSCLFPFEIRRTSSTASQSYFSSFCFVFFCIFFLFFASLFVVSLLYRFSCVCLECVSTRVHGRDSLTARSTIKLKLINIWKKKFLSQRQQQQQQHRVRVKLVSWAPDILVCGWRMKCIWNSNVQCCVVGSS